MIAPLVWLIVTSLTEPIDAFQLPPRWMPRPPTLENFQQVPDLIPFAPDGAEQLQIAADHTAGRCSRSRWRRTRSPGSGSAAATRSSSCCSRP